MNGFRFESQGAETMLVYQLEEGEHLDSFAKGMLQSNDMTGILRPSFMQRDKEQYLKFPVTSRISLQQFIERDMEKDTVLNLFLTMTNAIQEVEEYMLDPDKILLDPDYIFVNIRQKEAGLVYLPVDEFTQDVTVKEFFLYLLGHMQYELKGDLSYVAKLIHFLNQKKPWTFEELRRHISQLLNEQDRPVPSKDSSSRARGESKAAPVKPPVSAPAPAPASSPVSAPDYRQGSSMGSTPPGIQSQSPSGIPENPGFPGGEEPGRQPKKSGIFSFGKKKQKASEAGERDYGQPAPMPSPGIGGSGQPAAPGSMAIPGQPMPPGGMSMPGQPASTGRRSKHGSPPVPGSMAAAPGGMAIPGQSTPPGGMAVPGQSTPPGGMAVPGQSTASGGMAIPGQPTVPGGMSVPGQEPSLPDNMRPEKKGGGRWPFGKNKKAPHDLKSSQEQAAAFQPAPAASSYEPAERKGSVYMDFGSSDEESRTVIMGGGMDYGSTMILGSEQGSGQQTFNHVVKIIRRRTGQSMVINKDLFRIGSEASFVDLFLGDNPAIGSCHANICERDGAYYIADQNSVNHTYVNGVIVQPGELVQLVSGNLITLADEDFDFIIS
ncbi:MAG: FHA domain-containing protein [Hungatella sp.]|nr:FHA domain-containing protein [Hungatella sp.]